MYVYEHINGTYHFKPDVEVRSQGEKMYFDSPNVKEWWHFITDNQAKEFVEIRKDKKEKFEGQLKKLIDHKKEEKCSTG